MTDYLILAGVLCGTGTVLMAGIYLKFRRNLASKMFGVQIPLVILVGMFGYAVGREGLNPTMLAILIPIGVSAMVVALVVLYRLTIQPLSPLTAKMNTIAKDHDLTNLLQDSRRSDEISHIQASFLAMAASLRDVIRNLQGGILTLSSSASEISASAQQAVSLAAEQAAVVSEVGATVEEITQTSLAASDSAKRVVTVSDNAVETGQRGMHAVAEAVRMISVIDERVEAVSSRIQDLREKNDRIGAIVETVNELAEQSNLLAVNASIEASRAGDQGRGFSVVASEVRRLAEQSKNATRAIQKIVGEIKKSSDLVMLATEESQRKTEEGRSAVHSVDEFIRELVTVLEQNSDHARQIAGASSQQAAGIKQIAVAMKQVEQGGKDSENSARQLEQAVVNLGAIGSQLKELVSDYNV